MCLALMASPGENAELGTDNSNFLTWNNPSTFKKKKLILPSPWTPAGLGPFAGLRGGLVPCCRGCAPSRGGRPPVRGVWLAPRGPRDRLAHLEPQWERPSRAHPSGLTTPRPTSLDNFFTVRDKKERSGRALPEGAAAPLGGRGVRGSGAAAKALTKDEDEWKEFEQKELDYSGLRVQAKQIRQRKGRRCY